MSGHNVVLVDMNEHFLRVVTHIVRDYYSHELTIVGACGGNGEALHTLQAIRPRIVLLDLDRHCQPNLQLIPELRAILPDIGIIVLGSFDMHDYREMALAAGADAFVAKAELNNDLLPAIFSITGGRARANGA
jgi:DNA-binding NarL/FixJ family response regulator